MGVPVHAAVMGDAELARIHLQDRSLSYYLEALQRSMPDFALHVPGSGGCEWK